MDSCMMALNEVFKALVGPDPRRSCAYSAHGERTAGELAASFDMTKPSMSHHFAVLKEADLIPSRREGQQIYYSLNTTVLEDVMARIWDLFGSGNRRKESLRTMSRRLLDHRDRADARGLGPLGLALPHPARAHPDPLEHRGEGRRLR